MSYIKFGDTLVPIKEYSIPKPDEIYRLPNGDFEFYYHSINGDVPKVRQVKKSEVKEIQYPDMEEHL